MIQLWIWKGKTEMYLVTFAQKSLTAGIYWMKGFSKSFRIIQTNNTVHCVAYVYFLLFIEVFIKSLYYKNDNTANFVFGLCH